jgi:murein hydrolase activator
MKILSIATIFFIISINTFTQTLTDLQKRKKEASGEIEYTYQLLDQTKKREKSSLNRLRLINNSLEKRNSLIGNLRNEVEIYEDLIRDNILVVEMLSNDIEQIRKEYAGLIRNTYLHRNTNDILMFLISSENFNEAYRRLLYVKHYVSLRKQQAKIIDAIQVLLNDKIVQTEQLKKNKQQLINVTLRENEKLVSEQTEQKAVINELKSQRQDLYELLKKQRYVESRLENEIRLLLEEEAKLNRAAGKSVYALTPEQKLVGDSFFQNKNRLPWPIERGIITEHFGIHQHPVLANVKVRNNGINIATEAGAKVRAVFNGEVSRIFAVTGGNTAIIVRHGKYLTVYSNLKEATVKKGDKVVVKQPIGTIFTDYNDNNKSVLKFQIWHENQKLDPEEWIGR